MIVIRWEQCSQVHLCFHVTLAEPPVSLPCLFLAPTVSCAHTGSPICAQNAPDSGMKQSVQVQMIATLLL